MGWSGSRRKLQCRSCTEKRDECAPFHLAVREALAPCLVRRLTLALCDRSASWILSTFGLQAMIMPKSVQGHSRRPDRAPMTFAVGTRVTTRPPHRSVRAQFGPHGSPLGCVTARRDILTKFRMRFSACDTVRRYCARPVLCLLTFPSAPALGSTNSAAASGS
jgi:hypothetical protein